MASRKPLKRELLTFLESKLVSDGFRRVYHQQFRRDFQEGQQILQIVFINVKVGFELEARVAIRHHGIEELYSSLLGEPRNSRMGTIGVELGRLKYGRSLVWYIGDSADVIAVGKEILAAFETIGYPFLEKYSGLKQIYDVLVNDHEPTEIFCAIPHLRAEKALVAAYLLEDEIDLHNLFVTKALYVMSEDGTYPYVGQFLEFGTKLIEKYQSPDL